MKMFFPEMEVEAEQTKASAAVCPFVWFKQVAAFISLFTSDSLNITTLDVVFMFVKN